LAALLVCLLARVEAGGAMSPPFDWELKPVSYTKGVELTELEFSFEFAAACEEMRVTFAPIGDLTILGETSISTPIARRKPFTAHLQVVLPNNDTSGVVMKVELCQLSLDFGKYFITTGETIIGSWRDPALPPLVPPSGSVVIPLDKSKFPPRKLPPVDSARVREVQRRSDSLNSVKQEEARREWEVFEKRLQRERKEELEKKPLTEHNAQVIEVDGQYWIRNKGEYKFRLSESMTIEEKQAQMRKSVDSLLRELEPEVGEEVVVDLRDPKHSEYLESILDDLHPTEWPGYYRCILTSEKQREFERREIG